MTTKRVETERSIRIEILKQYQKLTYLWDPTHKLYTNKLARNKGYEIMLEIWQRLDPDATLASLKKKLDNWRAAYRRERIKVENSKLTATDPDEIHQPVLWYYKYLTFIPPPSLNPRFRDNSDSENNEMHSFVTADDNDGEDQEECDDYAASNGDDNDDSDENYENPKKPRLSTKRKQHRRSIKREFDTQPERMAEPAQVLIHTNNSNEECSADLFGRALASQLKEVSKFQRCLAEKLISEIMFYAKLDQLNIDTSINIQPTD